jgi:hypothetical protein
MSTLPYPDNIGKHPRFTSIHGNHVHLTVEDEIIRPQGKPPHTKLIYLQKLRFEEDNHIEYRFTYYMEGVKGKMLGRWVFAQYSLVVPAKELKWLPTKARSKGWAGF